MSARSEYPGTQVPNMIKNPLDYRDWWGRMVMWSYKFGPYLLTLEDKLKRLIVVDTETGGLDDREHSILSLGAVVWMEDGTISEPFHMYIREEKMVVTPEALRVNGITEDVFPVSASPSFVVSVFEQWLHDNGVYGKLTLGGHNIAGFDMGFIRRLYRLAGKKFPFDYHVQDTMSLALALRFAGRLSVPNVKLDTLCAHFGIKIRETDHHNSGEDALATAKLFTALLDMLKQPVTTSG